MDDWQLLQDYAERGSETAFRTLVDRYLNLVHSAALRQVNDPQLAEEVSQAVFSLLARKAESFGRDVILPGWLFRTTRFVAARARRAEQRRQHREQEAFQMQQLSTPDDAWRPLAPVIDEALEKLNETDRNAVLLRFFDDRNHRQIGATLGVSEEAAKKRVNRAVDKLRAFLAGRGFTFSAAVLASALAARGVNAAPAGLADSIAYSALVAGGAATTALPALARETLTAWRWAKLKGAFVAGSGFIAVGVLLSPLFRSAHNTSGSAAGPALVRGASSMGIGTLANDPSAAMETNTINVMGETIPLRSLRVTMLDAQSGEPIAGAEATHSWMGRFEGGQPLAPLRTDSNGTLNIRIPERVPGGERMNQFEVQASAAAYAPRTIMWLSTTGNVLGIVSTQYTVRLEPGITLSGAVVDDTGQPLAGVRVGVVGNSYRGYTISTDTSGKVTSPPEVRAEDFPSFYVNPEGAGTNVVATDRQGRFQIPHFPSDLRALVIDLVGADGAHHKFRTPLGKRLTAEELPEVSFEELKNGATRLVIPRGVNVEGMVVNSTGEPVKGATVVEGNDWGNPRVLSRNLTDSFGHFRLANRAPREIILTASAEGHATVSVVVSITPEMGELRVQLPAEQPLRGRVVNEAGQPLPEATVAVADFVNHGQWFEWTGKADGDGRFVWRGAPTNEVGLGVTASGYAYRIVRLQASAQEDLITLRTGNTDVVRVTGKVTDAESGAPVERFRVKIGHNMTSGIPEPPWRTNDGAHGELNVEVSKTEIPLVYFPAWHLQIEADDYEPTFTRAYYFEEGDQHLDFALVPGGTAEGLVHSPDGERAANAQLGFALENDAVLSSRPGELSRRHLDGKSDVEGHFKLAKPVGARALVAFHDSGWAITPLSAGARTPDIRLKPWARIEGTVTRGDAPVPDEQVGLNKLTWDWSDTLTVLYSATTDSDGHFVFDKVPAGEFELSVQARAWQRRDYLSVRALQTSVTVEAGETRSVTLGASGRPVLAQLRATMLSGAAGWSNALPILMRDVGAPPEPARSEYIGNASHMAARRRYAHDPAVLAALREARNYVGTVTANGTAIFERVPPGRYVLEVKLFAHPRAISPSAADEEGQVAARLRAAVLVPEGGDNSEQAEPVFLGEFTLEPL